jgi:pimeloyl-ACP methyl ester carboxylesterase
MMEIIEMITLSDGRTLGYAEYGDPNGKPVFFFHGIPGSRVFRPPDELTKKMGVRLICVERPGYGISTFQPGRRLTDWPCDVAQLADTLGIKKFALAGHSGGGPYTAACACKLPDRVTAAAILSGLGPLETPEATKGMLAFNKLGLSVARYIPWPLWRLIVWQLYHQGQDDPAAVMEKDAEKRPAADAALWEQSEIRQVCYASTAEGLRDGTRGLAWDLRIVTRLWGFRLEDIRVPVYLWQGTDDNLTTSQMARYMAGKIPDCKATFCEGEAHLLLFQHWEEILDVIRKA